MSGLHSFRRWAITKTFASWSVALLSLALGAAEPGEDNPSRVASTSDIPSIDPFLAIAKRNAFGIKPPPPPPPPEATTAVPPPPSNLFLTGISVINGIRKAYLVQVEAAGKPPKYLTLDEAHGMQDGIRLLEIDARKRVVRVQNGTEELALNFKDNAWKGNGGNPGTPGPPNAGPPGMRQIPQPVGQAAAPASQAASSSGPTIIRRGGGVGQIDSSGLSTGVDASGFSSSDMGGTPQATQRSGVYLGGSGSTAATPIAQSATPNPNQVVAPVYTPVAGSANGAPAPPSPPPLRR